MKLPKYPLASRDKLQTFEFISEGRKGLIHKLVQYKQTNLKDIFNLAFGDKDHTSGEIDDTVISNNGDSEKVLATVVNQQFTPLLTSILTLGFMQQAAQKHGHDFTEWELQNIYPRLKRTSIFWERRMTIGKLSETILNTMGF